MLNNMKSYVLMALIISIKWMCGVKERTPASLFCLLTLCIYLTRVLDFTRMLFVILHIVYMYCNNIIVFLLSYHQLQFL